MRIVSLISSATEIVCALGLGDSLVGISHECDYPDSIKGLPVVSEPKVDPLLPGEQIDRDVRALVREGLSVYRIKTELLASLQPDLIITQDQCDVCAVSLKDVEAAVCSLTLKATQVCSLKPFTLKDIREDFLRVGRATGAELAAARATKNFDARLAAVTACVAPATRIPRVAMIEWLAPVIIAGGWIPEIVRIAGGVPVIVGGPEPFRKVTWVDVRGINPDCAIVMPCGYPIEKTLAEMKEPTALRGLMALDAVVAADGNAYFNRPGPRIVDSAEILAAILHPELGAAYAARYRGAYVPWTVT